MFFEIYQSIETKSAKPSPVLLVSTQITKRLLSCDQDGLVHCLFASRSMRGCAARDLRQAWLAPHSMIPLLHTRVGLLHAYPLFYFVCFNSWIHTFLAHLDLGIMDYFHSGATVGNVRLVRPPRRYAYGEVEVQCTYRRTMIGMVRMTGTRWLNCFVYFPSHHPWRDAKWKVRQDLKSDMVGRAEMSGLAAPFEEIKATKKIRNSLLRASSVQ